MRPSAVIAAICLLVPSPLCAQDESSGPVIRVVGTATEQVQPDYARISIGVTIQAKTPEEATAIMSQRIATVVDTLVALGFSRDSLPTRVFSIVTDRDYDQGNRVSGYTSALTLLLRTSELRRIAEFIGAALRAGATEIADVSFGSTQVEHAREAALRRAVAAARREATVIAEAQGGTLGSLLQMSTAADESPFSRSIPLESVEFTASRGISSISIMPQALPITARVTASWRMR